MKIRIISYAIGLGMLVTGLTAIAREDTTLTAEKIEEVISEASRGNDCIFSRTVNNWTILDRRSLILYAPTKNRPYYVQLNRPSFDLKFAHSIGVYSRFDNRLCPYGGNALFIDGDEYRISAIKKLDPDVAKQLVAHYKKDAGGDKGGA